MQSCNNSSNNSICDLESIVNNENTVFVEKKCISDKCCEKISLIIFFTSFLGVFAICDLYFAQKDNSCLNQTFDNLEMTMKTYLLISGAIGVILIYTINVSILCLFDFLELSINNKYNYDESNNEYENKKTSIIRIIKFIYRRFSLAWLLIGCILFWKFLEVSKCSKPVYNYLLVRFILFIIFNIIDLVIEFNKMY